MFKNINKSSGQIAKALLALAIIILIAIVIVYIVVKRAEKPPPPPIVPVDQKLVYEVTLGDIRFLFLEATDRGSVLYGKDSNQPQWQKNLETTERFIEIVVAAQNVGKEDTPQRLWELGEIIDSEGRKFISASYQVANWLPPSQEDLCGSILKPSFEPSPCKKIYEVAKISTGLKIKVFAYDRKNPGKKLEEALLDIKLMP